MTELSSIEKSALTALQRGIPITSRPFHSEDNDMLEVLKRAKAQGMLRRFGGIFDTRRLGYRSVLCALEVHDHQMDEKAALISAHPGVTHCYERRPMNYSAGSTATGRSETASALQKKPRYPTLWFTLAVPHDAFDAEMASLHALLGSTSAAPPTLHELPALRRFKIDVVFDLQNIDGDETYPKTDSALPAADVEPVRAFSEEEKALIRMVDQDVPLVERPFAAVGTKLGLTEETVLSVLRKWKAEGVLRRVGAVLYHREAGFTANAMCVWPVEGDIVAAGRRLAARPEVTHCYQRPRLDAFPFDLYAMIHAGSWTEIEALFQDISADCGLNDGKLFASGKEFKKSSMRYFR